MTIAELVINLGLKGADSAGKALGGVKAGLGEVKSMSLEAKAAIIGAIYALERMMSASAKTGTGLMDFTTATGISAKTLQQWQWGIQQVGGAAADVEGSIRSVQSAMTKTLMGEGAPKGLSRVAELTGGITEDDLHDTMKIMEKLRQYALLEKDVGRANENMRSFGVSDGFITAARRDAFDPDKIKKAPIVSDAEINQLNKVDVAWGNFNRKFTMGMNHLTAKYGLPIVGEISKLADLVLKLGESLVKLAEKTKIFELIGRIFSGWGIILEAVNDLLGDINGKNGDKESNFSKLMNSKDWDKTKGILSDMWEGTDLSILPKAAPNLRAVQQNPAMHSVENTINQTLQFNHDGTDFVRNAESQKKAAAQAYSSLPAMAGGH